MNQSCCLLPSPSSCPFLQTHTVLYIDTHTHTQSPIRSHPQQVRATTLRLIGELAEWIDKHHDVLGTTSHSHYQKFSFPHVTDTVLQFILDGLKIPSVASHAAKAVQSVCEKCKTRMALHFHGLFQVWIPIPPYTCAWYLHVPDNLGECASLVV